MDTREGWDAVPRRWITQLDAHPFRLMCWLASHTDEYLADLSQRRVADELDADRGAVGKWLRALQDVGLVQLTLVDEGYVKRTVISLDRSRWNPPGQPMSISSTPPVDETGQGMLISSTAPMPVSSTATTSKSSTQDSNLEQLPAKAGQLTARDVTAAYVDVWREVYNAGDPPKQNIGRVSRDAKELLAEGRDPADVLNAAKLAAAEGHANVPSAYSHMVSEGKRRQRYSDERTRHEKGGMRSSTITAALQRLRETPPLGELGAPDDE